MQQAFGPVRRTFADGFFWGDSMRATADRELRLCGIQSMVSHRFHMSRSSDRVMPATENHVRAGLDGSLLDLVGHMPELAYRSREIDSRSTTTGPHEHLRVDLRLHENVDADDRRHGHQAAPDVLESAKSSRPADIDDDAFEPGSVAIGRRIRPTRGAARDRAPDDRDRKKRLGEPEKIRLTHLGDDPSKSRSASRLEIAHSKALRNPEDRWDEKADLDARSRATLPLLSGCPSSARPRPSFGLAGLRCWRRDG